MNKQELITVMSEMADMPKKKTEAALKALIDVISEELAKDEKIQLVGFGTFETVKKAARVAKNPQNGKAINIPASKAPKFKAGKALKDIVNK